MSWKVYQNMPDNFGDNSLAGFMQYRRRNAAIGQAGEPDCAPPRRRHGQSTTPATR